MKKLITISLSLLLMLAITACSKTSDQSAQSSSGSPETVTIKTLNAERAPVDIEVPFDPKRLAVMDLAALDIIDNLGLGDRVVGVSKGSTIDYLQTYVANDSITNLGTIKEVDLEAVMSSEPDLIFIGARLSAQYDELSKIAPVVFLSTNSEIGLIESIRENANTIASIFGVTDVVNDKISSFGARINTLTDNAKGKTAIIGLSTTGSFNILGNDGRASIIGREIGYQNLAAVDVTSTHGNESSFELLVELNPEYIFVMDRDAAINAKGAKLAQEIMQNELVMKTDAYKNGNIVYLKSPAVWYTAEGGITALNIMLSDLESELLK